MLAAGHRDLPREAVRIGIARPVRLTRKHQPGNPTVELKARSTAGSLEAAFCAVSATTVSEKGTRFISFLYRDDGSRPPQGFQAFFL